MLKLLASHPDASIFTGLFSRLQYRNRSPNTYETRRSRREYTQTSIELYGVSQDEIENDLEVRLYDARQRRAQVFAMDLISQLSLFLASHVAAVRHGHKNIQRNVKCWNRGISLQRLGKARFARACGPMQNDRAGLHRV